MPSSIASSDLNWNMVGPIFEVYMKNYCPPKKAIEIMEIQGLHSCLLRFTKTFGRIFSGKEAKRLFFYCTNISLCVVFVSRKCASFS